MRGVGGFVSPDRTEASKELEVLGLRQLLPTPDSTYQDYGDEP